MKTGGWCVREVAGRALVGVRGRDAARFLQGLTTNNLLSLHGPTSTGTTTTTSGGPSPSCWGEGRYTAFLTPTGRLLADALVYRLPDQQKGDEAEQSFLVECDARTTPGLIRHFRRYRLRAHVDITAPPEEGRQGPGWAVGVFLPARLFLGGDSSSATANSLARDNLLQHLRSQDLHCFVDPRTTGMGLRVYYRREEGFTPPAGFAEASTEEYHLHRILHAVPEGVDELEPNVALPLECNLDALNGVSYDKGCYLGQELTSRVHHTGVVRKRLMPALCFSPEEEARERELRVVERILDFVHGRDASAAHHLLPSALWELPSVPALHVAATEKAELHLGNLPAEQPSAESTHAEPGRLHVAERRPAGRICGGINKGLGFALLRLHHASTTLTGSTTESGPFLAKPLWPPPYPLPL